VSIGPIASRSRTNHPEGAQKKDRPLVTVRETGPGSLLVLAEERDSRPVRASLRSFINSTRIPKSRFDASRVVPAFVSLPELQLSTRQASAIVFTVDDRGRQLGDVAILLAVSDRGVLLPFPVLTIAVCLTEIWQAQKVADDVRSIRRR
jgi:hypothetical protein